MQIIFTLMKRSFFLLYIFLIVTLFSCAKRGTITGGPKDTLAPVIVNSYPKNFSTQFKGNEIKIVFNELIKVKDINKQLIISPPLKKQPIIVPQGSASKFISIKILDTLKENTTYSFNFGKSIVDNNESNPYNQFKFVFSTGNYIDSLSIAGKVKDSYLQKTENNISLLLYDAETFKDSMVYTNAPLYVSNTLDTLSVFSIENIKEGKYKIIALKDANSNYKFDAKQDKIGFLKNAISVPTDTVYELEIFKEKLPFKALKPSQESKNKFYLPFEGEIENLKISANQSSQEIPLKISRFPKPEKDTLQIFIPDNLKDSISFKIEANNYKKSFVSILKDLKEKDTLNIEAKQTNTLSFREQFTLNTSTPIKNINNNNIKVQNKDSLYIPFTTVYNELLSEIEINFLKEEKQNYTITLLPNAIIDFYNKTNDTLMFNVKTKSLSDYGNLKVNLKNVKRYPVIVQGLDSKGNVKISKSSTKENVFVFDAIEPMLYTLRVIYDDNANEEWDTGNYLEKKLPEEIIYLKKTVDVRANWDVEQDFDLQQ
mgnify:CR=1 FL=1